MSNKLVWNLLAEDYGDNYLATMDWKLGYSVVEGLLGDIKGKRILDYGCGSGKFTKRLQELGASIDAVDVSENAIARAQKEGVKGISYRTIREDDLSFVENDSLDAAVSTFVLCTMQQDSQVTNVTQQIYRKLRLGGYFVILEPHPDALGHDFVSMKRKKPSVVKTGTPIEVQLAGMQTIFHDYWRSRADYVSIIEKSGFKTNNIKEPVIEKNAPETHWKDELIHPPFLIIQAKK